MDPPILHMEGICKSFPGVAALTDVSLEVAKGEVHALLGENGAGKSTLLRILAGAQRKDAGVIRFSSQTVDIKGPKHARELGIAMIYQELSILPHVSIAENVFLGHAPRHRIGRWLLDRKACIAQTSELLGRLGLDLNPSWSASRLKVAEQQMVEIAKALSNQAKLVVMDEPTTSLSVREVDRLLQIIRILRSEGVSTIYVSHRLDEVKEVCDRATILRDGRNIRTVSVADTHVSDWVRMMVGRDLDQMFPPARSERGPAALQARHLETEKLRDVSFSAFEGEILGIGGLVGAGRTELARALFGADRLLAGSIIVDGKPAKVFGPSSMIAHGVALVPEDRKGQGLVLPMTVKGNITLASLGSLSRAGQLNPALERRAANEFVHKLRISTPSINQIARNLSGGNQQKVVLGKWLLRNSRILIVDEPTRGIDVGAKSEVYAILRQLASSGAVILMISSELSELIGMSDRILVMREGRVVGTLTRSQFSEERIMRLAMGVGEDEDTAQPCSQDAGCDQGAPS